MNDPGPIFKQNKAIGYMLLVNAMTSFLCVMFIGIPAAESSNPAKEFAGIISIIGLIISIAATGVIYFAPRFSGSKAKH